MLDDLWEMARRLVPDETFSTLRINAACNIERLARPNNLEHQIQHKLLLLTTIHQGTAVYDDMLIESPRQLIGHPVTNGMCLSVPAQVALLDSLLAAYRASVKPTRSLVLDGLMEEKVLPRNRFICDEVIERLKRAVLKHTEPTVSLIGVSSFQAKILHRAGIQIQAWDRNPEVIGMEILPGIRVQHSDDLDEQVRSADVALVTGMAMANNSLPAIITAGSRRNTSLVVWAVTGANLAPYYLEQGVDSVVSETFPFYFLQGRTQLDCYRRP